MLMPIVQTLMTMMTTTTPSLMPMMSLVARVMELAQRPKRVYPFPFLVHRSFVLTVGLFDPSSLEKEMERYVPRTKPSKPAIGAQPPNPPYAQGKTATSHSQATKSGRPAAVTATGKTTAPRPKKK